MILVKMDRRLVAVRGRRQPYSYYASSCDRRIQPGRVQSLHTGGGSCKRERVLRRQGEVQDAVTGEKAFVMQQGEAGKWPVPGAAGLGVVGGKSAGWAAAILTNHGASRELHSLTKASVPQRTPPN